MLWGDSVIDRSVSNECGGYWFSMVITLPKARQNSSKVTYPLESISSESKTASSWSGSSCISFLMRWIKKIDLVENWWQTQDGVSFTCISRLVTKPFSSLSQIAKSRRARARMVSQVSIMLFCVWDDPPIENYIHMGDGGTQVSCSLLSLQDDSRGLHLSCTCANHLKSDSLFTGCRTGNWSLPTWLQSVWPLSCDFRKPFQGETSGMKRHFFSNSSVWLSNHFSTITRLSVRNLFISLTLPLAIVKK